VGVVSGVGRLCVRKVVAVIEDDPVVSRISLLGPYKFIIRGYITESNSTIDIYLASDGRTQ